jgi:hypothetical protein
MGIETSTVERLIRRYWNLEKISIGDVSSLAADILGKAKIASSLHEFKLELNQIQVTRLRGVTDDEIATRVFAAAHT